jgi:tetratricopeptide (TPR) repeat protein
MHVRLKWFSGIGLVLLVATGIGVWLMFVINSAFAPVIQCAPAQAPSSPPAALVTAADYLAQGDYEFDRGDCARAIAAYSRAIELNPSSAEAYNNRAFTYMTQKDYAHALPDLDHAIALRPNYVNALINRGDIFNYYYQIDQARAVADYDRVIAQGPAAYRNTSVCGHRLVALNGSMTPGLWLSVVLSGHPAEAGCESNSPGY